MKLSEKQRAEVAKLVFIELQPFFNSETKVLQKILHKIFTSNKIQSILEESYKDK